MRTTPCPCSKITAWTATDGEAEVGFPRGQASLYFKEFRFSRGGYGRFEKEFFAELIKSNDPEERMLPKETLF